MYIVFHFTKNLTRQKVLCVILLIVVVVLVVVVPFVVQGFNQAGIEIDCLYYPLKFFKNHRVQQKPIMCKNQLHCYTLSVQWSDVLLHE